MDDTTACNEYPNPLQKQCIIGGPVTCVSLPSKEHCWVGKGCFLEKYIFNNVGKSKDYCQRYLIFPDGGTIHGLRHLKDTMVLFGGRKVTLWKSCGETLMKLSLRPYPIIGNTDYIVASDWIWDVRISTHDKTLDLALGLANNSCELWIIEPDLSARRTHKINGVTRCITYSISFHGWNDNTFSTNLILASGTVFNEIIIWNVLDTSHTPKQHQLQGHCGVILSVQFSQDGKTLASTSDDRSVRLWKCHTEQWECAWVSWGHSARVWSVAFSSRGLISTAEDATARIWDLDNGTQVAEIRSHTCQSLWSVDVYDHWVLIGGNDGSAKLYDLDAKVIHEFDVNKSLKKAFTTTVLVPNDHQQISFTESIIDDDDICHETKQKKKLKAKVTRQVIFGMEFCHLQGRHYLIVTTRSGSTLALSTDDVRWSVMSPWWSPSIHDVHATDGSCMAVNEMQSTLAIGTTRGNVLVSPLALGKNNAPIVGTALNCKSIKFIYWVDAERVISMHINGIAMLWHISDQFQLHRTRIFNTGLGAIPTCYCVNKTKMVIGDCRGNVVIFEIEGEGAEDTEIAPISIGSKYHKKEHVNAVVCHNDSFLSAGNDGSIIESHWSEDDGLQRNLSVPCFALSGLTHIWTNDDSVIVAGYHGNLFLVVDTVSGYELFRVDTGGRQRNLACYLTSNGCGVGVCVSQNDGTNSVLLHRATVSGHEYKGLPTRCSFGTVLHGEPVFDVSLFNSSPFANYTLLLTGSEDCTSKVLVIQDDSVVHSLSLPPQESCVRAVSTSHHVNSNTTLMVICGGKLQINVYLLRDTTPHNETKGKFELAISSLQACHFPSKSTIDHRINAVCSVPLESPDDSRWHAIATGDSNGCVNLFIVSEDKQRHAASRSLCVSRNLRTVLSLCFLRVNYHLLLFAGTTGGDVIVWSLSGSLQEYENPIFEASRLGSFEAHQSGTNSIDAQLLSTISTSSQIRICSGGDDQAITVCTATFTCDGEKRVCFLITALTTLKDASYSAINGVAFVSADRLMSVGYSQRLAIWEVKAPSGELTILASAPIDVADVNCISLCLLGQARHALVAIGGEGVDLQNVTTCKPNLDEA